jgi:hypothetical protein
VLDQGKIYVGLTDGVGIVVLQNQTSEFIPSFQIFGAGTGYIVSVVKVFAKNGQWGILYLNLGSSTSGAWLNQGFFTYNDYQNNLQQGYSGYSFMIDNTISQAVLDGTNLYVVHQNNIRRYYNLDPTSYIDYNNTNNSTLSSTNITQLYVADDLIIASSFGGVWLKKDVYEESFSFGTNNITDFSVVDTKIYIWSSGNTVDSGLYVYDYIKKTTEYFNNTTYYLGATSVGLTTYQTQYFTVINDASILNIFLVPSSGNTKGFEYYIQSDYGIESTVNQLSYWIVDRNDPTRVITKDLTMTPTSYSIYRVRFLPIKDFDTQKVETQFAAFDYEQSTYVETPEIKLYATDYTVESLTRMWKTIPEGEAAAGEVMIVSSEYISDDELWEVTVQKNIGPIWEKNATVVKWGYQGSNSHADYTYKLNNSFSTAGIFNRTTNMFKDDVTDIREKNLDYFYRVGNFYSDSGSTLQYYLREATNIETAHFNYDSRKFNLDLYFQNDWNYFDFFFKNTMYNEVDGQLVLTETQKYAIMVDDPRIYESGRVLFKGLNYEFSKVQSMAYANGILREVITDRNNHLHGWKFTFLFNPAYDWIFGISGLTERQTITPLTLQVPYYLQAWSLDGMVNLGIQTFDSGQTNNYKLGLDGWSGVNFLYQIDMNTTVLRVFKPLTTIDALYQKNRGHYYLLVTGFTLLSGINNNYSFVDTSLEGNFVLFSGDTYYTDILGNTTQFYNLQLGTGQSYIDLQLCDDTYFSSQYLNWIENGSLYEDDKPILTDGAIFDYSQYIDNTKLALHVLIHEKYQNVTVILNQPMSLQSEYYDLNNTAAFGEN